MTVTGRTMTFGFRAASIIREADAGALAVLADLDLIQARRHAAVLTGCMLGSELADLQVAAEVTLRGLAAVQARWTAATCPPGGRLACSTAPLTCQATRL